MTREEKELLLKDISARLPYGVKVQTDYTDAKTLEGIQFPDYIGISDGYYSLDDMECKPYLFPLSSMTKEQEEELIKLINTGQNDNNEFMRSLCRIEFYHINHFDYRGLIPMGLANDATGLNIY